MGAIFIEFVPNLADKVSKAAPGAVYGVILIAMLFLMPMGAGGFPAGVWRKVTGGGRRQDQIAGPGAPEIAASQVLTSQPGLHPAPVAWDPAGTR